MNILFDHYQLIDIRHEKIAQFKLQLRYQLNRTKINNYRIIFYFINSILYDYHKKVKA